MSPVKENKANFWVKIGKFFLILFAIIGLIMLSVICYNWLITGDIELTDELQFGFWTLVFFWGILAIGRLRDNSLYKTKFKYSSNSNDIKKTIEYLKQTYNATFRKERTKLIFKIIVVDLLMLGMAAFYIKLFVYTSEKMVTGSVTSGILYGIVWFSALVFSMISFGGILTQKDEIVKEYIETYKNFILPNVLKCVDSSFNLERMQKSYDSVVIGYEGKIRISNIEEYKTVDIDLDSGYAQGLRLTFVGELVTFNPANQFNGYVKIKTSKEFISNLKKINTNHAEFNKYFYVYAHNEETVPNILNKQLIELLLAFYKKYNVKFEIVFENSNIYIKLFVGRFFNSSMFGKIFSEKKILQYYNYINSVKELCLALDENIK